jgi:hypothetical protein
MCKSPCGFAESSMTEEQLFALLGDPQSKLRIAASLDDMRALALAQSRFAAAEFFRTRSDWDGLIHFGNGVDLMLYAMGEHALSDGRQLPRLANKQGGVALEFGVATGATINRIARNLENWRVFGFDSFEGIPEPWERHPAGAYAQEKLPEIPANVALVKGWFSDTLPGFVGEHAGMLEGAGGRFPAPRRRSLFFNQMRPRPYWEILEPRRRGHL